MLRDVKHEQVWDQYAQDDPIMFTYFEVGHDRAQYDQSGQAFVDDLLLRFGLLLPSRDAALEIGSGLGRLTIPMAGAFESVVAIDLSTEFLRQLEANCAARGVTNVATVPVDGPWGGDQRYDFALSMLVFQHIVEWDMVLEYFTSVQRALRPGGVFVVQFDTRPPDWRSRVRRLLPDAVLPKMMRTGIRRIRRPPADIRRALHGAGLTVLDEDGADTAVHVFIARRPPLPTTGS